MKHLKKSFTFEINDAGGKMMGHFYFVFFSIMLTKKVLISISTEVQFEHDCNLPENKLSGFSLVLKIDLRSTGGGGRRCFDILQKII